MKEPVVYTTTEAADRLGVHARTVRKWIDAFADYVRPELNSRGHYKVTEAGLRALQNIQKQLRIGNKSLRQVRERLIQNGHLVPDQQETAALQPLATELQVMMERLTHIEAVQRSTLESLKLLHAKVDDIQKKQDQLKMEIRNATFQQRLQAAGDENKPKRLRLSQLFR